MDTNEQIKKELEEKIARQAAWGALLFSEEEEEQDYESQNTYPGTNDTHFDYFS